MKLFLGILMIAFGLMGLGASLCGLRVMFTGGIQALFMGAVFGVIPGIFFFWIAHVAYNFSKRMAATSSAAQAEENPHDPK